ncbi:MAG: hypothetical protein QM741_14960 [Rudaea sp.]|uniref:hypothetical protein n=1 Tax=Rudaea sp. TaxID=2136325 RepID=UPI0039E48417
MLASSLVAEGLSHGVHALGRVLDAIDQVVRVFALEALVEREGLQAGEADEIGVLDLLGGDAVAAQQFRLDFGDLVQVENDRRVRDVQSRDRAFRWQRLHLAASEVRCVGQQFQDHQRTVFGAGLPTPRELLSGFVLGALEAHLLEVVLQRVIGLGVGQDLKVDHDVHVQRTGVRRNGGRPCGDEVTWCEPSDQIDRILPRSETAQQRHEDTFAVHRVLVAVAVERCGLGHQKPILSLRKCSAISLERPSPRSRSR